MKMLSIFGLILLISCGKENGGAENPVSSGTGSLGNLTPEDIVLSASRRYAPSQFNSHELTVEKEGHYLIPTEIEVLDGNSGKGWLQLRVGDRKFCFQGNASSPQSTDGTLFVARWEKSDLSEPCHSSGAKIPFNSSVSVLTGDIVKLDGGGCAKGHGACLFTEVEVRLNLQE